MLKKAKAQAKASWEDAKLSPSERTAKTRAKQQRQIEEAKARTAQATEHYKTAKVSKKK